MVSDSTMVPYIQPPDGKVAFGDDSTLWNWFIATISICGVLSLCAYAIRIFYNRRILGRYRWEDLAAFVCFIGLLLWFSFIIVMFKAGGGTHGWNLTIEETHRVLLWFNTSTITYSITTCIIKLTILQMYRGIFVTPADRRQYLKYVIYGCQAAILAFYLGQTIAKLLECFPRQRIWDKWIAGHCEVNKSKLLNSSGIFNFLTDLLILVVPGVALRNLQATKWKRLRLYAGLTFGSLAPILSVIGFVFRDRYTSRDDVSYYFPLLTLYATAELTTGFICLCFPSINGLIMLYIKKEALGPSLTIVNGSLHQTSPRNLDGGKPEWNRISCHEQTPNHIARQSLMGTTLVMTGKENSGAPLRVRLGDRRGGLNSLLNSPVGSLNDISNPEGHIREITSSTDVEVGLFSSLRSSSDTPDTELPRALLKYRKSSATMDNTVRNFEVIPVASQLPKSGSQIVKARDVFDVNLVASEH